MKYLKILPILIASVLLVSCFGAKDEPAEPEKPKAEAPAETTSAGEADPAKPAGGAPAASEAESTPATSAEPSGEEKPTDTSSEASEESSAGSAPAEAAAAEPAAAEAQPDPAAVEPGANAEPAAAGGNPKVKISTTMGDITVELFADKSPQSVANFLSYAKEGYYKDTVFHRVIEGFMVQGGGFGIQGDGSIQQKDTKEPVQNEAKNGVRNKRGTIAMARTSAPHSATSQFFINHSDNDNLDYPSFDGWGYAVFGEVVEGLDIVDKIAKVPTGTQSLGTRAGVRPMKDVPNDPIVIQSITIIE